MLSHEAAQLLAGLCAAFPSAKFPPETQRLYLAALERLPYESTRDAVEECIGLMHRMPSIAAVREAQQRHQARHLERDRQRHTAITDQRSTDEVPYTNAERRADAEMIVTEAATLAARHGHETYWSHYLRQLGEVYAENANRVDRGIKPIANFRISDLVAGLLKQSQLETDVLRRNDARFVGERETAASSR